MPQTHPNSRSDFTADGRKIALFRPERLEMRLPVGFSRLSDGPVASRRYMTSLTMQGITARRRRISLVSAASACSSILLKTFRHYLRSTRRPVRLPRHALVGAVDKMLRLLAWRAIKSWTLP